MEEIADELADNINSEKSREKCRSQPRNLLIDPLVTKMLQQVLCVGCKDIFSLEKELVAFFEYRLVV
jgi:hypothetical protein